ncbi:MAG: NADH-quinone oxidoreductase subunit NuoE [Gammaproteobacteria bacterium]|nr:NADH-quinone oxidoreductase subunit NuoE [Gammaproteobacteria bacterium]
MDGKPKWTRAEAAEFLGAKLCTEIDLWVKRFPEGQTRAASIAALREAQHENQGYLELKHIDAVAAYLGLPEIQLYETASFYSMLETRKVGRHSVSVCTNVSCMLCGGEDILAHLESKLGVSAGESTTDGRIYLMKEEECLAACAGAPMMMVDHVYYTDLTPERVDEIIDELD